MSDSCCARRHWETPPRPALLTRWSQTGRLSPSATSPTRTRSIKPPPGWTSWCRPCRVAPDVIIDGQIALAEAAVRSRVRRFVTSDFAIDLYDAPTGAPQCDIRREADARIDSLPLEVVHVLNGGFMDLMLDPRAAHIIDLEKRT